MSLPDLIQRHRSDIGVAMTHMYTLPIPADCWNVFVYDNMAFTDLGVILGSIEEGDNYDYYVRICTLNGSSKIVAEILASEHPEEFDIWSCLEQCGIIFARANTKAWTVTFKLTSAEEKKLCRMIDTSQRC